VSISYDIFVSAFLSKISEYQFLKLDSEDRTVEIDGYLKRAITAFKRNCEYDLFTTGDDNERSFKIEIAQDDLDELVDIISEGMVVQWLKPYVYKQELLENVLNTKDFTEYSPASLLLRVRETYNSAQADYKNMIYDYSYTHGDLTDLHL